MSDQDTLRWRLKRETDADHRRLDARVDALDLGDAADYRCFLEATAAALLPLEAALEAGGVATLVTDWPERRRTDALLADLGAAPANTLMAPALDTPEDVMGTLYVLEGSRLGGQILLKRLAPDAPRAYLGHGSPRLWRSFIDALDAAAPAPEPTIEAARRAFDLFFTAFAPVSHGLR